MSRLILIFISIMTFPCLAWGQGRVFTIPDSIKTLREPASVSVTSYLDFQESQRSNLTVDDIVNRHFSSIKDFDANISGEVWYRLALTSSSREVVWLSFNRFPIINVFYKAGNDWQRKQTGSELAPRHKDIVFDIFDMVELELAPGEVEEVVIQCKPQFEQMPARRLSAKIFMREPFSRFISIVDRINFAFLVILVSLFIYNLCLFGITKGWVYRGYIAFFITAFFFVFGTYYFTTFLTTFYALRMALLFLNLAMIFYLRFIFDYLKPSRLLPGWIGYLNLPLIFSASLVVAEIALGKMPGVLRFSEQFTLVYTLMMILLTFIFSIISYLKGYKPAKYLIISCFLFSLFGVLSSFLQFTLVLNSWGDWNMVIVRQLNLLMAGTGVTSQILLFSLVLGYRIISLEKEKSQAIREKLQTQESINLQLEQKVTERTAQLEHRNRENELLLGEIHHRVKNNLQVISSLLKLQSRQLDDGKAKSAVLEGRDRVKAMALIHQRLYQQDQFSAIEMHDYVLNLVENLAQSYGFSKNNFRLDLEVPELHLDVDSAIPIGLIINELVSNAFKHAFQPDRENQLTIKLQEEVNTLILKVRDNGPGIITKDHQANSFGLQLIEALTEELKGKVVYEKGQGTAVRLSFTDYKILTVV